ncbi:hypothetical protein GA0070216_1052 [Micromonospora matsumotoense]|uniref:Uncharacterized protein n=1 Tax=Micromonospora matsumotoense TaxID=121616 RepID=A0A1C4XKZ4_9ACTN|nr:hypothetical protein GA0070216_1052 [Micromonospora matsumotoense]
MAAGGAAASAVIGTVIGAVANRITSSEQAVRDDRAVEQAKRTDAQRKPPIAANAYYYNRSDEAVAWVLPAPLTSDQRQELLTGWQRSADGEGPDSLPGVVHGVVRFTDARLTRLLTRIRISAVGQWTGPVFVRQIRARVLKRSAPMSGTLIFQGSQGDGEPLRGRLIHVFCVCCGCGGSRQVGVVSVVRRLARLSIMARVIMLAELWGRVS